MRTWIEISVALTAAAAVHVAVLAAVSDRLAEDLAPPEEADGPPPVITAADGRIAELVAAWETPPETGEAEAMAAPPSTQAAPVEGSAEWLAAVEAGEASEALQENDDPGPSPDRPVMAKLPNPKTAPPPSLRGPEPTRMAMNSLGSSSPAGLSAGLSSPGGFGSPGSPGGSRGGSPGGSPGGSLGGGLGGPSGPGSPGGLGASLSGGGSGELGAGLARVSAPPPPPPEEELEEEQAAAEATETAEAAGTASEDTAPLPRPRPERLAALTDAGDLGGYRGRVRAEIERRVRLPGGARGTLELVLRIEPTGRLAGAEVGTSSGDDGLDAAAMAAVREVGAFPPPPGAVEPLELAVTLAFRPE